MPSIHRIHLEQVLSQKQKELATVQSLVKQLFEECLHLRREINATNPIMLLPMELKMNIFCLSKHNSEGRNNIDNPKTPLLLGAVCNEWRGIVLNVPQLWDTIRIPFYNEATGRYMQLDRMKLATLQEWLDRGKQCPLSIEVVLRDPNTRWEESPDVSEEEESPIFRKEALSPTIFLETIIRQSHRWKHIGFYYAIPDDFRHQVFHQRRDFTLLHSLCICVPNHDFWIDEIDPKMISTFSNAPSLREAEIRGFAVSKMIKLPWNQLEKLHGQGDLYDVYDVLCVGDNLVECEISADVLSEGHALTDPRRITVPKLQRLTLHGFVQFSRLLDLPSLTYLKHGTMDFNFNDFSGLIEYSSCPLKGLDIRASSLDADFMRCMRLLPSLTTLNIFSNTALPPYFLEGLKLKDADEHILLPNLEVLKYHGSTDFHFGTLLTMLRQRHRNSGNSVSPLQYVRIRSMNDIPGFDEAAMGDLETSIKGLELDIKVWNSEGGGFGDDY